MDYASENNQFFPLSDISFTKLQISNSVGDQICPATNLVEDSIPHKAYYECPMVSVAYVVIPLSCFKNWP